MKKWRVLFLKRGFIFLLGMVVSCKPQENSSQVVSLVPSQAEDYSEYFEIMRRALVSSSTRKVLTEIFSEELVIPPAMRESWGGLEKLPEFSESHFLTLLEAIQETDRGLLKDLEDLIKVSQKEGFAEDKEALKVWRAKFKKVMDSEDLKKSFLALSDPLTPLELKMPSQKGSYQEAKLFVNHKRIYGDKKEKEEDDLEKEWIYFINQSQKELVINVFDFDLNSVADSLEKAAQRGVSIRVGIDKKVIETRQEVQKIYDRFMPGGKARLKNLKVYAVHAVSLNHQKMAARDWSSPEGAAVLFSSGNLTRSCSGKGGDLAEDLGTQAINDWSVPNANHLITMKSYVVAQLIHHELTKTFDLGFRGKEYPLHGVFRIPRVDHQASFDISFTPRGSYGDPNRDMISKVIREGSGAIRMLQFAFSSKVIEDALYERAQKEMKKNSSFSFYSVSDTSFSMREWSVFLRMSGYSVKDRMFAEETSHRWRDLFSSPEKYLKWTSNIRAAPTEYGDHRVDLQTGQRVFGSGESGETGRATAKIHHKVLLLGNSTDPKATAIIGTSYNFSDGAKDNQEQILVFRDLALHKEAEAMFAWLYERSGKNETVSIHEVAGKIKEYRENKLEEELEDLPQ